MYQSTMDAMGNYGKEFKEFGPFVFCFGGDSEIVCEVFIPESLLIKSSMLLLMEEIRHRLGYIKRWK